MSCASCPPETSLYHPVKQFLENRGFTVRGEVGKCDVVARAHDRLCIVELKNTFNLHLVYQALDRQMMADETWVAIPFSRRKRTSRRSVSQDMKRLCQRLGIGLLEVYGTEVSVLQEASASSAVRQSRKRRSKLDRQFSRLSVDHNTGGSPGSAPRVTGYLEDSVRLAALAIKLGEVTAVAGREAGVSGAASILINNHKNWFIRVARGRYRLTEVGLKGLEEFDHVLQSIRSADLVAV